MGREVMGTDPFHVVRTGRTVDVWAAGTVQFAGQRAQAWQDRLVRELAGRPPGPTLPGEVLAGTLTCAVAPVGDVENVVFTNLGPAALGSSPAHPVPGWRWRRVVAGVSAPVRLLAVGGDGAAVPTVHLRYEPSPPLQGTWPGRVVARWSGVDLPGYRAEAAPTVWWGLRRALVSGRVALAPAPVAPGAEYAVRLVLRVPPGRGRTVTGCSKALVDGVLSALHQGGGRRVPRRGGGGQDRGPVARCRSPRGGRSGA